MVPSDRVLTTSYRLSIVAMFPSAAVWLQFFNGKFQSISGRISETMRNRAKVIIDH